MRLVLRRIQRYSDANKSLEDRLKTGRSLCAMSDNNVTLV